jgi:hypothetical protein
MKAELERLRTLYAVPEDTEPSGPCNFDTDGWDGYDE